MTLDLAPELEQLVQTKVNSGNYRSVSELVSEALRLLDHRDRVFAPREHEILEIEEGWQSIDRQEFVDEEVFEPMSRAAYK
jgi:antitoxin ParD1/3/4